MAVRTPLLRSRWLSDVIGRDAHLKLECLQTTGSFKVRGAANKIAALQDSERAAGVIATSSGNHGLATATVASRAGIAATICVPEWVDPAKLAAIRAAGAELVVRGATADESERVSLKLQAERGLTYVHPFDDPHVIAGQGTIGHELLEQHAGIGTVVVPTSGGGLIAGIAVALSRLDPTVHIVAACADSGQVLAQSVRRGRLVELPEEATIATALAGNLGERNEHSLRLASELVDEWVVVPERAILRAMRDCYAEHRLVVEGGGAVGIAALQEGWRPVRDGAVAIVLSGGNIDLGRFADIVRAPR